MDDLGPTVDLLFISKYKRQLLEMVEELKELKDAHSKKIAECQRLRSEVIALQAELWAKDMDVTRSETKEEVPPDTSVENLRLQAKEVEGLKHLKEKLKLLVESTQSKLREAEARNYELEDALQKRQATSENKSGLKEAFPHELAQRYIEMHSTLGQKVENLKGSLEAVKAERQAVLRQQLDMRSQLDLLNAVVKEQEALKEKRERERHNLCNQIDMLSAKLDEATQDTLILKQSRKEDEEELARLSERLAEAMEDRAALLRRLDAMESERRALQDLVNAEGLLGEFHQRIIKEENLSPNIDYEDSATEQQRRCLASNEQIEAQGEAQKKREQTSSPGRCRAEAVQCQRGAVPANEVDITENMSSLPSKAAATRSFPERKTDIPLARTSPVQSEEKSANYYHTRPCPLSTSPPSITEVVPSNRGSARCPTPTVGTSSSVSASAAVQAPQSAAEIPDCPLSGGLHAKKDTCAENLTSVSRQEVRASSDIAHAESRSLLMTGTKQLVTFLLPSNAEQEEHKDLNTCRLSPVSTLKQKSVQEAAMSAPSVDLTEVNMAEPRHEKGQPAPICSSDERRSSSRSPPAHICPRELLHSANRATRSSSVAPAVDALVKLPGEDKTAKDRAHLQPRESMVAFPRSARAGEDVHLAHVVRRLYKGDGSQGVNQLTETDGIQPPETQISGATLEQVRSPCSSTQRTVAFDCDTLLRAIPL